MSDENAKQPRKVSRREFGRSAAMMLGGASTGALTSMLGGSFIYDHTTPSDFPSWGKIVKEQISPEKLGDIIEEDLKKKGRFLDKAMLAGALIGGGAGIHVSNYIENMADESNHKTKQK